jgi:uncharacterized membrane protein YhaH (DUF805 family)
MNYFVAGFKKYAVLRGRASRTEYWMFAELNVMFGVAASILGYVAKVPDHSGIDLTVPFVAVAVRRLHDTGKSGWWCLLGAIPLVGTIWLIVLLALPGNPEENAYGPPVMPESIYVHQPQLWD